MLDKYIMQVVSVENECVSMLEENYRMKTVKHHDGSMVKHFHAIEHSREPSDEKNICNYRDEWECCNSCNLLPAYKCW
jgi:hypothetical protein